MTNTELTEIREALNLTKGELAKKLDVSPMILGRYEKGSLAIPEAVAEKVKAMVEPKPKRRGGRTVRRKKTPEETTVSTPEEVAEAVKAEMARLVDEFNKTSDEKFEVESVQVEVVGDSEPVEKQDIVDAVEKAFKEQLIPVAEEQKPVEEKPVVKKSTVEKKSAKSRKKKAATPSLIIQSLLGGTITPEEIIARVPADVDTVYIKPEENKAYWVKGEETGSITLW